MNGGRTRFRVRRDAGELDLDTFNAKLAKLMARLKKDAGAESIRQNYRGTGSRRARRQLYIRFKSGAVIDVWLDEGFVKLGGVVWNPPPGSEAVLSTRRIPYNGRSPEEVYKETVEVLRPWANPSARDAGRRKATRIPRGERAESAAMIRKLVKEGYSPRYAARKAYRRFGRDVERSASRSVRLTPNDKIVLMMLARPEGGAIRESIMSKSVMDATKEGLVKRGLVSADGRLTAKGEKAFDVFLRRSGTTLEDVRKSSSRDRSPFRRRFRKLSAAARRRLPATQFALPLRRQLPIPDAGHTRAAASRLSQMYDRGTVTKKEYPKAKARIRAAEKRFGIEGSGRDVSRGSDDALLYKVELQRTSDGQYRARIRKRHGESAYARGRGASAERAFRDGQKQLGIKGAHVIPHKERTKEFWSKLDAGKPASFMIRMR